MCCLYSAFLPCVYVHRWRSDSLTVIKTPENIDSNKIVKHAYSRYNLSIGIGLSQVCCKIQNKAVGAAVHVAVAG